MANLPQERNNDFPDKRGVVYLMLTKQDGRSNDKDLREKAATVGFCGRVCQRRQGKAYPRRMGMSDSDPSMDEDDNKRRIDTPPNTKDIGKNNKNRAKSPPQEARSRTG